MRRALGDGSTVQDIVTSKPPARIKLGRMEPEASNKASEDPPRDEGSNELERLLGQARPVETPESETHSRPRRGFD